MRTWSWASDATSSRSDLVRVNNDGVAFGALGGGGVVVALVIAAAVGALLLLVFFARHATSRSSGAADGDAGGRRGRGNDDGAVTDFVKLPHWPAFNLADAAITLGVLLLLVVLERDGGRLRAGPDDAGARLDAFLAAPLGSRPPARSA